MINEILLTPHEGTRLLLQNQMMCMFHPHYFLLINEPNSEMNHFLNTNIFFSHLIKKCMTHMHQRDVVLPFIKVLFFVLLDNDMEKHSVARCDSSN